MPHFACTVIISGLRISCNPYEFLTPRINVDAEFLKFRREHQREYSSALELKARKLAFVQNLHEIYQEREKTKKSKKGFRMKIGKTPLADRTKEERDDAKMKLEIGEEDDIELFEFTKMNDGYVCPFFLEIRSEAQCKQAADALGLRYGRSWNGHNDFPGCHHANDGRNKVFFNKSNRPNVDGGAPNYAGICLTRSEAKWVEHQKVNCVEGKIKELWNVDSLEDCKSRCEKHFGCTMIVMPRSARVKEVNRRYCGLRNLTDTTSCDKTDDWNSFQISPGARDYVGFGGGSGDPALGSSQSQMPPSIDWVAAGKVTAVEKQGTCGGCWAFVMSGMVESQLGIRTGKLVKLSRQYLLDCDREKNRGCHGGRLSRALRFIQEHGICSDFERPYVCRNSESRECLESSCDYRCTKIIQPGMVGKLLRVSPNHDSVMRVLLHGPLGAAINTSGSAFDFYRGGPFYAKHCEGTYSRHAVLLVGYGTLRKKRKEVDYWKIKNQWGMNWGEKGYLLLERDKYINTCGIYNWVTVMRFTTVPLSITPGVQESRSQGGSPPGQGGSTSRNQGYWKG